MRIVVAGGAGFIGSHLVRALIGRGDRVVVVDDMSSGRRQNLSDLDGAGDRFKIVYHDVAKPLPWSTVPWTDPAELVVDLASPCSPVDYATRPLATLAANSKGTWNLLDLAAKEGARFIYASTSEVYGDPLVHPQPETYWGNVDPIGPRSMYDESKRFGEALVTSYRRESGLKAAIVRPFNTYGPAMRRDDGRVVTEFIAAAEEGRPIPIFGGGAQTRSFMFIDDMVRALMHLVDDLELDGQVLNVGNPSEVSMQQLASAVGVATGKQVQVDLLPARDQDPQQRKPVIDRMKSRYGWVPRIGLAEGLGATVRWWRGE